MLSILNTVLIIQCGDFDSFLYYDCNFRIRSGGSAGDNPKPRSLSRDKDFIFHQGQRYEIARVFSLLCVPSGIINTLAGLSGMGRRVRGKEVCTHRVFSEGA